MIRSVGRRHATLDACKFKIYSSTVLSGHLEILAQNFIFLEYAPEISKLLIRFKETLRKNGAEF
jgi:hypothetical protein